MYQAELNQSFPLMVAAVKKTHMIHGDTANIDELENLTAPIKEQATDMLHDQGLSIDDYVLFPVHPGNINIFCRTSLRKRLVKNWLYYYR